LTALPPILQYGALGLLGLQSLLFFWAFLRMLPLLRAATTGLLDASSAFARVEAKLDAISGRALCPLLLKREDRATEPEVVT